MTPGDWINQRNEQLPDAYCQSGRKKTAVRGSSELYSAGLKTNRDAWVYNCVAASGSVQTTWRRTIDFYNAEVDRYAGFQSRPDRRHRRYGAVDDFINSDTTTDQLEPSLTRTTSGAVPMLQVRLPRVRDPNGALSSVQQAVSCTLTG